MIAGTKEALDIAIKKAAKIGYEQNIKAAQVSSAGVHETSPAIDLDAFKKSPDNYTVIDVRNRSEINEGKIFNNALTIPLPELRRRLHEIPTGRPIVVHCAAGYRSAAATSIIAGKISSIPVYDLSDAITEFMVNGSHH